MGRIEITTDRYEQLIVAEDRLNVLKTLFSMDFVYEDAVLKILGIEKKKEAESNESI